MDVRCSQCGTTLDITRVDTDNNFDLEIEVVPCDICLEEEKQDEIDTLEARLEDEAHWQDDYYELEERIKELENQ